MEDLEKYPFKSCPRCYWRVNRHTCQDVMNRADLCQDFRPAKITRVKQGGRGGA